MLTFFRRALRSKLILALLALVVIAFVITGVGAPIGLGGGGPASDSVASIDSKQIPTSEVAQRIQSQYQQARQQQPDLTMPGLIALAGGINAVVDEFITGKVLEVWAGREGIVVSDKLVDAQIADIPAFRGLNGQFDEKQMAGILGQQRMTLAGLRESIRGDLLRRLLIAPIGAAATAGDSFTRPYAGIIVAKRDGAIGLVPFKPEAVSPPTPAEIDAWYKGHLGRYSLPERRVIRYAPVDLNSMQVPTPSDAAVEAKYKADAGKYAAIEKRQLEQVVLADEAAAKALAAKVASGTPFDKAAAEAGFDAPSIALGTLAKADFANSASPAIADAAFAAPQNGITTPIRSPLGWHVVHVVSIARTPGRSFAEVRGEILGELLKTARTEALNKAVQKIDDALSGGSSFDDIVKANALTVVTSPPVTSAGAAPTLPDFKPDPALAALLKPAFLAAPEDAPTMETVGTDGQSALLALARVVPAAPLPLDQVRGRIVADITYSKAAQTAKAVAEGIKSKVDAGMKLEAALAEAGYPAPQPISISQLELRGARDLPPVIRSLFTLTPGKTVLAPGPKGVFLVHLDRINDPAPELLPVLTTQIKGEIGRSISDEYVVEFANAARRDLTIRKNPAAIQALGRQLAGQASTDAGQ